MQSKTALETRAIVRGDRVKPFERRHPWIFAGAIDSVKGSPVDGGLIGLYAQASIEIRDAARKVACLKTQ